MRHAHQSRCFCDFSIDRIFRVSDIGKYTGVPDAARKFCKRLAFSVRREYNENGREAQHIWSALRDTYIKLGHEDYLDILKEAFQQYGHNLDWDMTFEQAQKVVPLINGEMIK